MQLESVEVELDQDQCMYWVEVEDNLMRYGPEETEQPGISGALGRSEMQEPMDIVRTDTDSGSELEPQEITRQNKRRSICYTSDEEAVPRPKRIYNVSGDEMENLPQEQLYQIEAPELRSTVSTDKEENIPQQQLEQQEAPEFRSTAAPTIQDTQNRTHVRFSRTGPGTYMNSY